MSRQETRFYSLPRKQTLINLNFQRLLDEFGEFYSKAVVILSVAIAWIRFRSNGPWPSQVCIAVIDSFPSFVGWVSSIG